MGSKVCYFRRCETSEGNIVGSKGELLVKREVSSYVGFG